jgi:type IV pilus assembly protein PilN
MEIIQQLQVSRPEMVHLFDEIAQRVPEGVALMDIAQNDRRLVINGIAQSNAVVSNFLNNLAGSPWLAKPVLKVIQVRAERDPRLGTVLAFTVQVDQSARRPVDADPAT